MGISSHSVLHCRAHILWTKNMKAAFFICLALASSTYATVLVGTTVIATALTTTQAASFYYGVAAVKALALGALGVGAILGSRSRRQVEDVIMRLFEDTKAVPQASPVFDFAVAAEVGKLVKDVQKCEIQYTCPMTGAQLQKMLVQ